MVVSLNTVSLIILWLVQLATTISVRDTIITSLVAPQNLTVTSTQVRSLSLASPLISLYIVFYLPQWIHLGLVMANVGLAKHPEQYYVHR